MTFFTPSTASTPCAARSESPKLRAKQGHAKSAKPFTFNAKLLLRILTFSPLHNPKFKIQNPRASAARNRGSLTPPFLNSAPRLCPDRRRGLTPRYCVAAFTLVELLAVVGIMGLLAAVAVPALKGLTGSGGRKQALSQVMGALEIARNTAIAGGTNASVAVIFPDSTFDSGDAYKYRSMAVVARNATNSATAATMVGSWIVLPQGIAFFPNSISALPQISNISVRILTSTNPPTTFRAICFQSDGALDEGLFPVGNPLPKIALFEGTVDGTAAKKNSKTTMFETVNLTRYTGRAIPTVITNEP